MEFQKFNLVLILALTAFGCLLSLTPEDTLIEVEVTSGVSLIRIEDVLIYKEEEQLVFPLPDIDDLEELNLFGCSGPANVPGAQVCSLINHTNIMINQSLVLSSLLRKLYTVDGLSESLSEELAKEILDSVNVEQMRKDPVFNEVVSAAGLEWFKNVTKFKSKKTRGIGAFAPLALSAIPRLSTLVRNLFINKGAMVQALLGRMAYSTENLKPFNYIYNTVSELVNTENQGAKMADTELKEAKKEMKKRLNDGARHEPGDLELIILVASVLPDIAYLQYHNLEATIHAQGFATCRSNEIPIGFLPPSLLSQRLSALATELTQHEMVIPPSEVMKYYKSGRAHCVFSDDGGILAVDVPLMPAGQKLELFKVSSILYAWEGQVCDVGIDEIFVLRDVESNDVFPITEVDQELCQPYSTKKCQVPPPSTADTDEHLCLRSIMRGASTTELRHLCKLSCHVSSAMEVSQPTPDIVVITNLKDGAIAKHKRGNIIYKKREAIGATRVHLPCGWKLEVDGKIIAKSLLKFCLPSSEGKARFDELVPAHWTHLDSWVSKPHDISHGTRFKDFNGVINSKWNASAEVSVASWVWINWEKMSWITSAGQFGQGLIAEAQAAGNQSECSLPVLTEIVIYLTLALVTAIAFPSALKLFKDGIVKAWNYAVAKAAAQRIAAQQGGA